MMEEVKRQKYANKTGNEFKNANTQYKIILLEK